MAPGWQVPLWAGRAVHFLGAFVLHLRLERMQHLSTPSNLPRQRQALRPGDFVVEYDSKHVMQAWADVVLFPATGDFDKFVFPSSRPETQAWVAIAGESSFWWEHVETLKEDQRFDLTMGYSRQLLHMHASYFPDNFTAIMAASSEEHRRQNQWPEELIAAINVTADVVFFASNCNSEFRQSWVEGLMEAMPVDSYGACLKNKEMPEGLDRRQRLGDRDATFEAAPGAFRTAQGEQSNVKIQVVSRYKFGLAIENTRDPDYITEKVYEVLEAGAVPVYLGAPNWQDFIPLEGAIIDAGAFDSPHDLAEFLKELAADDARYQTYHKWRSQPLPDRVRELEQTSFTNNLCNICRWKLQRDHPDGVE
eukprot:Tamp_07086.p1 GENE.Tamp_07086~~Tamp_07086.p1  ORF type:complete len:364 (+),score=62.18 Tamp_07086:1083-2174(+)